MATRKEKVNAGLFLLIGLLLITGTIAVVAGLNLEPAGAVYFIKITKSVGGLRPGSAVKFLGVPVGRVVSVDFPPEEVENVVVVVEITNPSAPLKATSFATLSSNLLTGETTVELQGGRRDEPQLAPGSRIEWQPTTLMRLEDMLPGISEELRRVVAGVNAIVTDTNRTSFARLIEDMDALAREAKDRLGPAAEDFHAIRTAVADASARLTDAVATTAERLDRTSRAIEVAVNEISGRVDQVAADVKGAGAGIAAAVTSFRATAERLEGLLATGDDLLQDERAELRRSVQGFAASARELEDLLGELRRNPSSMLLGAPVPERRRGDGP